MKTRFIKSVVETSKTVKAELPFQRGARRTESIARRKGQGRALKSA